MILVMNMMIDGDGDDDPGVAQDAVRDQEGGGQRDLGLHGLHRGAGGCLEENWRCGYFVFDHLLSSNSLKNSKVRKVVFVDFPFCVRVMLL